MGKKVINILFTGVGGQGILRASDVVSDVFFFAGKDVKKSEVHGMAQRGGSVVSHLRIGDKVYSPLIKDGDVDILFSFELLEAYRYIHQLKEDGAVVVNNQRINPPAVAIGEMEYPKGIAEFLKENIKRCYIIDALDLAIKAGNARALNMVMTGALSTLFEDVEEEKWIEAIKGRFPEKLHEVNIKAFKLGREAALSQKK